MDPLADTDGLFVKLKADSPGDGAINPSNDHVERMIEADTLVLND